MKNCRAYTSLDSFKSDHWIVSCRCQISYRQNILLYGAETRTINNELEERLGRMNTNLCAPRISPRRTILQRTKFTENFLLSPKPWLKEEQDSQATAFMRKTRWSRTHYFGDYPVQGGERGLSLIQTPHPGTRALYWVNLPRQWQIEPCGKALCLQAQRQSNDHDRTENSGLLRRLLSGEIVLADRGFDIADRVGFYQARLHILAFTRGKNNCLQRKKRRQRKLQWKNPCGKSKWSCAQRVHYITRNTSYSNSESSARMWFGSNCLNCNNLLCIYWSIRVHCTLWLNILDLSFKAEWKLWFSNN